MSGDGADVRHQIGGAIKAAAADKFPGVELAKLKMPIETAGAVTARDLQRTDGQWTRAKGMDTFCPVGNPVDAASLDPATLSLKTRVNGQERQRGRADEMAFPPQRIVSFVSHMMTLEEGDLVLTGTPDGIGPLSPGDTVTVRLSCGSSVTSPVEEGDAIAPGGPGGTSGPPPG